MADSYEVLYQEQPDNAAPETLFTVPLTSKFAIIVKDMEVINVGADTDEITVWMYPDGESIEDKWIIRPATEVHPGEALPWEGTRCLHGGYTMAAQSLLGGNLNMVVTGLIVDETPA